MSSKEGTGGSDTSRSDIAENTTSVERQLFESLVHQLIEKGVLTKNDALSIVQTVAEVKRGEMESGASDGASIRRQMAFLERLYTSFELVSDRAGAGHVADSENVLQLRPPIHGDRPKFPKSD